MNILVTGASGFLGKHLCLYFEKLGYNVVRLSSKDVDLTDQSSLSQIPRLEYSKIFHLAAWTRAGDFCDKFQGDQWIINQQINTNILSWWKKYSPNSKLIAFGTSVSYAPGIPLVESNYMTGVPMEKFYSYAMTKRMLLVGLETLKKQYDMNYLYVVPSTIYGPDYHTDGRQLHFIYDIIRKFVQFKRNKTDVVLWGDGTQIRELIYVNDFVECLVKISENNENIVVNLGSGQPHQINEFARLCCKILDIDYNVVKYDTTAFVGSKSKTLNIELLRSFYNEEFTSLESGMRATIHWFQNSFKV